jgi:hypothetical protein
MSICLRRREFIAGLGGAAAWPLAAGAQQGDRVRRIGVLMPTDENDPLAKAFVSAFTQALAGLGWIVGRNVRIDLRWAGGDIDRIQALAREVVVATRHHRDRWNPGDLCRPAGDADDPDRLCEETAARSLKVAPIIAHVHSDAEIETAIVALGREPGGGLAVMGDVFTVVHRVAIILAVARNNVPAVYPLSVFVRDGGLLSYGVDQVDTWRRAATYVDRILRGEKPGDLPVQFPTKFEMVVNRRTAKALGLEVPLSILVRADEVIE